MWPIDFQSLELPLFNCLNSAEALNLQGEVFEINKDFAFGFTQPMACEVSEIVFTFFPFGECSSGYQCQSSIETQDTQAPELVKDPLIVFECNLLINSDQVAAYLDEELESPLKTNIITPFS